MNRPSALSRKHILHAVAAAAMVLALAGCDDSNAPIANAGLSQNVTTGTTITFDGTGSTDADGDALTFSWTLVSQPAGSTATIVGANSAKPSFTPDLPGTYVASVTVSDGSHVSAAATVTVTASDVVGFDSMPAELPPNYPSYGFAALSAGSIGDQVTLKAGTPRTLAGFVVGMSSWSCQTGTWNVGCSTTPGTSFQHPVTISFFNNFGVLLATKTQTFTIPYRPSPDPTCPDGTSWKSATGICNNGMAFKIAFDLHSLRAALPDSFYYELSVNTNLSGPAPIGAPGPYDGINVGIYKTNMTSPSVGSDPKPTIVTFDGVDDVDVNGLLSQVILAAP